ncbi:hypothetical protein FRX31_016913 [Thalictrum thalictroides]|uniref:Uncharacterized protein n=1 Tax=Thalictrum thalictroides TaxID=46969 RepID=A0A7J6WA89_THATH|nr:hypothetical protein FRX31_016913 [Thalictrum thalictroides]
MTALTEISHPLTSTVMLDLQQVLAKKNVSSDKDCDEIAQNILNYGHHGGRRPVEFEESSDVASPQLWKTGPQTMVVTRLWPSSLYNRHCYQAVSSTRSQEIAGDREKLMQLIQNMPEDCYELSLKDIVENPIVQGADQQTTVVEERREIAKCNDHAIQSKLKTEIASGRKNNLLRSGSMSEGQFILKLFSPISLGIKKSSRLRPCAKVLPEGDKCVHKGWWEKRFLIHGDSKSNDSGTIVNSSSCNNSSSGRTVIDLLPGCWSFLYVKICRSVGRNKTTS